MTGYLVLGARSPAALEICRGLTRGGHTVFAADSMSFPLARWSRTVKSYFRLPAAVDDAEAYGAALAATVAATGADVVIPTCEEVFHLSIARRFLPESVTVLAEEIEKLRLFHDKFTFLRAADGCGIGIPKTMLLRSRRRLEDSWERVMTDHDIVYKRVYSRFAEGTLLKPTLRQVDKLYPSPTVPWIAQEYIEGDENCCYAVAVGGRLTAISVYRPLHRAGRGAGICFESVVSPAIEGFVRAFVERHAFSGQISFDFIVSAERGPFVIECNPRATSGVHLLPEDTDWAAVFDGSVTVAARPGAAKSMIGSAMASYGLKTAIRKGPSQWAADFASAKDAIWSWNDLAPAAGQFVATAELVARAVSKKQSALASTTADIEWNGDLPGTL
jgi:hypothetical protein|nr:hypothetical protein [Neorhizobium tomejilense]